MRPLLAFTCLLFLHSGTIHAQPAAAHDWPAYGGGPQQIRYSPLTQINRSNVKQLQLAWTYDSRETGGMQTQPIIVGNVLYALTPTHKAFALEAATGKLIWTFSSS